MVEHLVQLSVKEYNSLVRRANEIEISRAQMLKWVLDEIEKRAPPNAATTQILKVFRSIAVPLGLDKEIESLSPLTKESGNQ